MPIDIFSLAPQQLLYQLVLPFILMFAIFLAAIRGVFRNVFDNNTSLVIALAISILVATTPFFIEVANFVTQLSGFTMIALFLIVFVGGGILWARGSVREIYVEHGGKRLDELMKRRKKIAEKYDEARHAGRESEAKSLFGDLKDIDKEIEYEIKKRQNPY